VILAYGKGCIGAEDLSEEDIDGLVFGSEAQEAVKREQEADGDGQLLATLRAALSSHM
jgi:hypothetical protein